MMALPYYANGNIQSGMHWIKLAKYLCRDTIKTGFRSPYVPGWIHMVAHETSFDQIKVVSVRNVYAKVSWNYVKSMLGKQNYKQRDDFNV